MLFDESGFNEKVWWDNPEKDKWELNFDDEEFDAGNGEDNKHFKVYVTGGTHEHKFEIPWWNTPPAIVEYDEDWRCGDNSNDQEYELELIDDETNFVRFAGRWGYDYVLANFADGPPGPMYRRSQPWFGPVYWEEPWDHPLDIDIREGLLYD